MAHIDGGELVARALEQQGVRQVFALVGGHLDPILQACIRHGIRIIDTRHEQAAGHMADGWARTTGRPGVAIVTAGPGVTDVMTAVANAHVDAIPVVVLAGRSPLTDDDTLPLQAMDQLGIMRPITKSARCVVHTRRIPEYVAMAFREATGGRPGPVFLEIPVDVLFTPVEEDRVEFPAVTPREAPAASAEAVEKALLVLAEAQRPVILAGGGAWFAGAADALRSVAERLHIPVLANAKARGCLPEDHPLGFGGFGLLANPLLGDNRPDAVLILGARIGLFLGGKRSFIPPSAKVVQVDIQGEEIGRNRDIDLAIVADCRLFLEQLLEVAQHASFPSRQPWVDTLTNIRNGTKAFLGQSLQAEEPPVHPYRLACEIAGALPDGAVLVADGGEIATWMDLAAEIKRPGSWLTHGYLGCLGTGLPFALAAKVAHPERPVLLVTGDGSVGLNFAEFDTAVRHNLPVVTVVSNDQAWGMCKHGQELVYGKDNLAASELGPVRYEKAAEGFGVYAEYVERPADIRPAIERAFASGRPACINVMVDPDVISPITMAMAGGAATPATTEGGRTKVNLPYYGEREV